MGSHHQPDQLVLRAVRALPLLLALAGLAGCEEPTPHPPITWSGDHLDYGEIGEVPRLCGGTLPYMDEFVGTIQDRAQADHVERAVFYLAPDGWDSEWCPGHGYGCSLGNVAFGRAVPLEHELVHAALQDAVGDGDRVLGEGIAEAWGTVLSEDPPFEGDISEMLRDSSGRLDTALYPRAAHFVSFLLKEFGTTPVLDVMAMTAIDANEQQLENAFISVFGMDIASIVDAYAEYPECHSKAYSEAVWACTTLASAGTVDRSNSLEVDIRLTLDCSDEVTIGSDASELSSGSEDTEEMWQWAAFDVVEASFYTVQQAESPTMGRIELMRCDIGCPGAYQEILVPALSIAEIAWLELEPGRHVARFVRRVDAPGWMSVTFG
jgi:hypothetical protein